MGKKPVVHLRVYKGSDINYDSKGNVKNENQSIKLVHDTLEWALFMKHLLANRYGKVEVEKVLDGDTLEPIKDIDKYRTEVEKALYGDREIVLTPDQKRIAELEAKLDALVSGDAKNSEPIGLPGTKDIPPSTGTSGGGKSGPAPDTNDLAEARAEYIKVFGKKGGSNWTAEQIREKIAEASK